MSDEAACKHHEMTQHFAFHQRILPALCISRCTPWQMLGWLHIAIEETTALINVPPLLCESGLREKALESTSTKSVAQPHFATPQPPR